MNTPEDPVDAWLREENHYVEDGGFTAQVLKSLPRRRRNWLRPAILLAAITAGFGLAIRWLPWEKLPPLNASIWHSLDAQHAQLWMPWIVVTLVLASLAWGLAVALQWED
jgi:hypothetical protein